MEASALHAPAGFARGRIAIGSPLLRLRSDEQLVALFRSGEEDAFRVIHDRYRPRLLAYARQMLGSRQDAEDVLQEVFVRAYAGLRRDGRDLALRAWLYRVAHNRCVDQLRRAAAPAPELLARTLAPVQDPAACAEERESLQRLILDMGRLPQQQRSALLMRELGGMTYNELSAALAVSVPAVKSVLVRARVGLAQAAEARDTACDAIREELILAHDGRRRPAALARRHLRDCTGCREFRSDMRGLSRQLAALAPTLGPLGLLANALGIGSGSAAAGGGAAAGSGALTGSGAVAGGIGHIATVLAAAAVTAGGAVEIQHTLTAPVSPAPARHAVAAPPGAPLVAVRSLAAVVAADTGNVIAQRQPSTGSQSGATGSSTTALPSQRTTSGPGPAATRRSGSRDTGTQPLDAATLDPAMGPGPGGGADPAGATNGAAAATGTAAGSAGTDPATSTAGASGPQSGADAAASTGGPADTGQPSSAVGAITSPAGGPVDAGSSGATSASASSAPDTGTGTSTRAS